MISAFGWFWIIYISLGLFIMMDALVESWSWDEYNKFTKVVGGIVCVLLWPALFFMN